MKEQALAFDEKVPSRLKSIQEWFASIIVRPIDENSRMLPVAPSGEPMEQEAFDYIVPSPKLKPSRRIELYNQQYWWRLLAVLHESAPLVTRLFGYHDFNVTIGKPYLMKYPPNTWSLNPLVDQLPQWIEEEYQAQDKQLVLDAAQIDAALNKAFYVPHYAPIDAETIGNGLEKILDRHVRLQPHVHLFDFRYDLFAFRATMMEHEVEYWLEEDFPKLNQDRRYYFILYRTTNNYLKWEELSASAYGFLRLFLSGTSIEKACEWLEAQPSDIYDQASSQLHLWFHEWIVKQWLYLD